MTDHIHNAHAQAIEPFGNPSPRVRTYFHENTDLPTDLLRFVTEKAKPMVGGDPEAIVNGLIQMFLAGVIYEQDHYEETHRKSMRTDLDEQVRGLVGGEEQVMKERQVKMVDVKGKIVEEEADG